MKSPDARRGRNGAPAYPAHRQTFLLLGLCLLLAAPGCSSFEREWKAAAEVPNDPNDITGQWKGRWVSEASGHKAACGAS